MALLPRVMRPDPDAPAPLNMLQTLGHVPPTDIGGLLNTAGQGLSNNSDAFLQFGMGLMSGRDMADGISRAAQGYAQGSASDRQRQVLAQNQAQVAARRKAAEDFARANPDMAPYAQLFAANPETAADFAKVRYSQSFKDNSPLTVPKGATVLSRDGKVLFQSPDEADNPASVREYEYDMRQRRQRGETDLPTYGEWQLDQSAAKRPQTIFGAEKAYDADQGKEYSQRFVGIQKGAQGARDKLGTFDAMDSLAQTPGFYSGSGSSGVLFLKKGIAALGGDPKAPASMENFRALANKATLDGLGTLGTGVSNADRSFIEAINPTLDNTPQGNRNQIAILRKIEQRKLDVAKLARAYAKQTGRLDAGFDDVLEEWSQSNPLFTDEDRRAMAAGRGTATGNDPLSAADAIVGIGR